MATAIGTVRVELGRDPLLESQWHIKNTGSSAFASALPVAGNDMGLSAAWAAGYSGKGVKVAIVDSGVEAAHEDLSANFELGKSFNFLTGQNDPSPAATYVGSDHGTSVAGIVGATAFNGKGGRGVAFDSTLRGYNYLQAPTLANYAKAFGSDPISADNDVFNASFFTRTTAAPTSLPTFSGAYSAVNENLFTLRGGKGAIQIIAAGNEFSEFPGPQNNYCDIAKQYGVSCGDAASDERRGGYTPIIVGAVNAAGTKASYSTTGSALWVTAPGGEYGIDSAYVPSTPDPNLLNPAIVAVSRTGCANSVYPVPVNALDAKGSNPLAANCQYTAVMNGTSSAAPNVAGVVALMLQANPQLGWRDVRHILAETAKRVDPAFSGRASNDIVVGKTVVLEQGWVTNSAGWTFSNWYGFGAVDASAAVAMAKSYTAYLPPIRAANPYPVVAGSPYVVPPLSTEGKAITFQVSEPFNVVEHVTVFVNVTSTPIAVCNQLELTSPSGTKSILLHAANGFRNTALPNVRFLSNAFYGEPLNGTWTLRFFDYCGLSVPTTLSSTQPQVLLLSGH